MEELRLVVVKQTFIGRSCSNHNAYHLYRMDLTSTPWYEQPVKWRGACAVISAPCIIVASNLPCKTTRRYQRANKTQVTGKIFKLTPIHVSVIYQIQLIHRISVQLRENSTDYSVLVNEHRCKRRHV